MKLIIAAIATLILMGFTFTQNTEAFEPNLDDGIVPVIEILPWQPEESSWKNQGDAGIYRHNDRYIGLVTAAVRDASRPVTLHVELADDSIVRLDCKVTLVWSYYAKYRRHLTEGVPAIIEINPAFWDLDLNEVEDTYFLSSIYGKEWIDDVHFIPDASNDETVSLFNYSFENGWKHWAQVVPDYLGYVGFDNSGI